MHNHITILGSRHSETRRFKAHHIYQKLCDIQPDIILFEFPLDWEPTLFEQIEAYATQHKGTEGIALLKYLKTHQAIIRPFDIRNRNLYYLEKQYLAKEEAFEHAFEYYFKGENPSPTALSIKSVHDKAKQVLDRWEQYTIDRINSPECDLITDVCRKVVIETTLAIADLVPELQILKSGWLEREKWEDERDAAMVTNILDYNREYEAKKIVVICGYGHTPNLRRELAKHSEAEGFTLYPYPDTVMTKLYK